MNIQQKLLRLMMITFVILGEITSVMNRRLFAMRVSNFPYKNFEYNMRKAEALARLDAYLKDLLQNEGKKTFKPLSDLVTELTREIGIDKIMKKIEETMKTELEAELKQKGKEYFENLGKDYVKRLKPRLLKMIKIFEDLGLVMDQTLLEQALIAAVSAFEVYLRELAVTAVILNSRVRRKFHPEIDKEIGFAKLEEYGQDAKRVQGEIVADLIRLDINNIKGLFGRLLSIESIFSDRKTELKVSRMFEIRHVIIHRAGLADPKFKKITKSKGAIDTQIKLSQRYALNSIRTLREIVQKIEMHIHQASSVSGRCKTGHNQHRM